MGTRALPSEPIRSNLIRSFFKIKNSRKTLKKLVKTPGGGITQSHRLSPELSAIVGVKEASRGELMKLLWAYLKKNNLQCDDNKQYFIPDKKMAKVFGTEKLRGFGMSKHIGAHLLQSDGSAQPAAKAKPAAKKVAKKAKKEESEEDDAADDTEEESPPPKKVAKKMTKKQAKKEESEEDEAGDGSDDAADDSDDAADGSDDAAEESDD